VSWLSFDDDYTNQAVWDAMPYDTRWHYHALAQACSRARRYDGRLPRTVALRCSDVPDPERSLRELAGAGLLADLGTDVEVIFIDDFLPPAHMRPEQLAPRKRKNQADYRRRKCQRGEHDRHCPAGCPVRVTGDPDGNPGGNPNGVATGKPRVGSGRDYVPTDPPKGQGQNQDQDHEAGQGSVGGEADDKEGPGLNHSVANSQKPRVHNGPDNPSSDVQQIPIPVTRQSPAADRNAREGNHWPRPPEAECPECHQWARINRNGTLRSHRWNGHVRVTDDGKIMTRCPGGGRAAA